MATPTLTIDLDAVTANWRALDAASGPATATAAVVKADAYGLDAARVSRALAVAGVRQYFVATAEEGAALRRVLGPGPDIMVLSGHMAGDAWAIRDLVLTPVLNSAEQLARHLEALPGAAFAIQIDTGMNRLGMEPAEWAEVAGFALEHGPVLLVSHLACADDPADPMNEGQLALFRALTDGIGVPRSLAATGGILLGPAYHFDLTRPGIGLYGAAPFGAGLPAVRLSLPVVQIRELEPGETVGYGCTWTAAIPARIATLGAGYADGIPRTLSNRATLYAGAIACPLVGRVSMDLVTVDVTHLDAVPEALDLIGPSQGVDALAEAAGTIGYEILTGLGARLSRVHLGDAG
ncbi:MAG: alanine racemase [Rhodobacteraceae bacterium]|jgi:alanine racemase|nr:alanine racemase [Paracoccaceae bacterium]